MSKPDVVTFGCRLNSFESEIIRENADRAGLGDAVIFNTCAVTAEATRQARQAIRRIARERPDAKLIVTGCAAQVEPGRFQKMTEVSAVIGNHEKMKPAPWRDLFAPEGARVLVNDIMSVEETAGHMIEGLEGHTRAFIQVQNGCDHRCTFCIIPYGRGNSRSVPMGEVVDQVKLLVMNGYREVVLTGVDITSYGPDLPGGPSLGMLVERILKNVPDLERLRLSSIDSVEIDPLLEDLLMHEPRMMPHMHLSLQAGDNMILKRMKRRHSREDAIEFCTRMRAARPDMTFGADIIAGFPTETEEMFENSLKLVDDCRLSFLHVFPYSPREGTPAANMPQVDKATRKDRARRLREHGEAARDKMFAAMVDSAQNVLIEKQGKDGFIIGHTENFAPARIETGRARLGNNSGAMEGNIVKVLITGFEDGLLMGKLFDE